MFGWGAGGPGAGLGLGGQGHASITLVSSSPTSLSFPNNPPWHGGTDGAGLWHPRAKPRHLPLLRGVKEPLHGAK